MTILLYIIIFFCKVLENALATLRVIVISNGKRILGAFLAGATAILWVFTAGAVLKDVHEDLFKVFFFCFGTFVGSYVGCYIENKLALGNNTITCIIKNEKAFLIDEIRNLGYAVTVIHAEGMEENRLILLIMLPRRRRREVTDFIKERAEDAVIIAEKVIPINGGHQGP